MILTSIHGTDQVGSIATNNGGVCKTTDRGKTWAAKADAECLAGPCTLAFDEGAFWAPLGAGLPMVHSRSLAID